MATTGGVHGNKLKENTDDSRCKPRRREVEDRVAKPAEQRQLSRHK